MQKLSYTTNWASTVDLTADFLNNVQLSPFVSFPLVGPTKLHKNVSKTLIVKKS